MKQQLPLLASGFPEELVFDMQEQTSRSPSIVDYNESRGAVKLNFRAESIPFSLESTAKLAVEGRLDSNSAGDFQKQVDEILGGPVEILILDLSNLTYISSAGLRVLMTANNRLAGREGRVILTNLQPQIAKVVEMINKLPGLHVFANDEELDRYLNDIQENVLRKKGKRD